jgi:hypothetical protein
MKAKCTSIGANQNAQNRLLNVIVLSARAGQKTFKNNHFKSSNIFHRFNDFSYCVKKISRGKKFASFLSGKFKSLHFKCIQIWLRETHFWGPVEKCVKK